MSIKQVQVNGKKYWRMYVCERAKMPSGKVKKYQKNLLFEFNEKDVAIREEKNWKRKLLRMASKVENEGLDFGELIHRFQVLYENGYVGKKMEPQTLKDHISRLKRYCTPWMNIVCSKLTRGDGRDILRKAKEVHGASPTQLKKIKTSINLVFTWGIEEKLIRGVHNSPVFGLQLEKDDSEDSVPPILTLAQVKVLLSKAKEVNHPWYHVWAFALLTGMRSGELYALQWDSIDLDNKLIRVYESFSWRRKVAKSTKAGYWRNIPVSAQLLELIIELKRITGDSEFVLPRVSGWRDGYAAKHLRDFLKKNGIDKYVVFHTLRACFATHLLASGAEPAKVMKIGGWKDFKTFEIYIRLAGVDVLGATDNLKVLPTEAAILDHVKNLFEMSS